MSSTLTRATCQRYTLCVNDPISPRLRGAPQVTRFVYVVYVFLVTAFVASSIAQVGGALFGAGTGGSGTRGALPESTFPVASPDCARLLEEDSQAIELARAAASLEVDGDAAKARFARDRAAARDRAPARDRVCGGDSHDGDALAALARLERAAESHAIRTATELSPVRRGAQSFIRGHHP